MSIPVPAAPYSYNAQPASSVDRLPALDPQEQAPFQPTNSVACPPTHSAPAPCTLVADQRFVEGVQGLVPIQVFYLTALMAFLLGGLTIGLLQRALHRRSRPSVAATTVTVATQSASAAARSRDIDHDRSTRGFSRNASALREVEPPEERRPRGESRTEQLDVHDRSEYDGRPEVREPTGSPPPYREPIPPPSLQRSQRALSERKGIWQDTPPYAYPGGISADQPSVREPPIAGAPVMALGHAPAESRVPSQAEADAFAHPQSTDPDADLTQIADKLADLWNHAKGRGDRSLDGLARLVDGYFPGASTEAGQREERMNNFFRIVVPAHPDIEFCLPSRNASYHELDGGFRWPDYVGRRDYVQRVDRAMMRERGSVTVRQKGTLQ